MKKIKYIDLYKHLRNKENLNPFEAVRNILRVRKMDCELMNKLKEWLENENDLIVDVEVEGVSYSQLVNREGMKPVRAFLFLDWLKREPLEAMNYMMNDRFRSPMPELSDEDKQELDDIIEKFEKDPDVIQQDEQIVNNDFDGEKGEDIIIDESNDAGND